MSTVVVNNIDHTYLRGTCQISCSFDFSTCNVVVYLLLHFIDDNKGPNLTYISNFTLGFTNTFILGHIKQTSAASASRLK